MNIAQFILTIIPLVIEIMKSAQTLLPAKGQGPVRREIVSHAMAAALPQVDKDHPMDISLAHASVMKYVDKVAPIMFPPAVLEATKMQVRDLGGIGGPAPVPAH